MLLEKLVIPIGFDTGIFLESLQVIEKGITAVVDLAGEAVDRTKKWAEGLDRLGDVTGMSGEKLAAWQFVAEKAGVSTESLSQGIVILEKGLVKADGTLDTTGKQLNDFGVSVYDANGHVKDQSALMNDIAKRYAAFSTQQERVNFLTGIFGRSGANLVDVFDTLSRSGGIDAVTQKVQSLGLVLDPGQYEDFQRNLNEVQLTLTGLANAFTGPLLPGAQALLTTFTNWLQSPWVVEGIRQIGDALGTLLSDVNIGLSSGDWEKFWGDAGMIWNGLKSRILQALVMGLQWLDSNPTAITDFIDGIISSLTGTVENTPSSTLGAAAQAFVNKIADQIGAADWGALDLALGKALQNAVYGALDWAWAGIRATVIAWWEKALQPVPVAAPTYPNATGTTIFGLPRYDVPTLSTANVIGRNASIGGSARGRAVGGWSSGYTWAGERGRELIDLPSGSFVHDSGASQAAAQIDYARLAQMLAVEVAKVTG